MDATRPTTKLLIVITGSVCTKTSRPIYGRVKFVKNEQCEVYESNCSSTSYPCATGSLEAGTAKLKMLINAREHTSDIFSNLIGRN